ncbi:pyridoxamine 5'-phosphate oxidase family protein [Candidatus Woesearchaeota archaeon]|jgi:uncharacterized pyridoxamine 5'-phosphate oxidase family protein|nr:pyridoxamine 5'-phosphate oxidase family protein [Candidatus Woesearchaeota archaeon]MBT7062763.1 pyridoxamine 5'-phosphate oxidase family protein [Candidatus Woesearchaeota archaeon]MBT7402407.1 pyridoxamine 5'-phosphate oxidase family protein [Candidatus Woesearchaeota archaeon]
MDWKKAFGDREEIILATCSKSGNPRIIAVISLGFHKNKLLIGICQMKKSFENLKHNKNVSLAALDKGKYYYAASGKCEIYSSGEYFDITMEKSKGDDIIPHHVLVVDIKEVFDLDNVKKVF